MLEANLTAAVDRKGVTFHFTVTNADDEPAGFVFPDAMEADVAVFDDGREVWRWSEGRMAAQVVRETSLAPGEAATFEMEWSDPDPGQYRARAELRAREPDCRAETELTVPETAVG